MKCLFALYAAGLLCTVTLGACRSIPRAATPLPGEWKEIGFSEQAGEGDYAVSLTMRADSTFYQYYNIGKSRSWAGRTDRAAWARMAAAASDSAIARLQRLERHPGNDGHSASIFISQQGRSLQLLFDLLQNGRDVEADPLLHLLRIEQTRADNRSAH